MKFLLVLAFIAGSISVSAHADDLSNIQIPVLGLPIAGQFGIPIGDTASIEKQIKTALLKQKGIKGLENFSVDWSPDSLKCLKVESEMDPDAQMGICAVNVTASQVDAKAAIVKKVDGYSVAIIYADVE